MDVILNRTYYGQFAQVHVARQLLEYMEDALHTSADVHILCHALGTAVMHDTPYKLYNKGLDPIEVERSLSPVLNRLKSITMIANVSQLLRIGADPYIASGYRAM